MAGRQGLAPTLQRGSGDRVVGRDAELAWLRELWASAEAGHAGVAVVAGETGVGKTRLVREVLAGVDATVLTAACVPVAGRSLPFAPVVQLVRQLPEPARHRLSEGWLPDGQGAPRPADLELVETPALGGTTQLQLFEALLSVLVEAADRRRMLLVVEDLPWADPATLDFLAFLSRNLQDEGVLVLLTTRTDDLPSGDPLRGWLAELTRAPSVHRLDLGRLDRDATREQVRDLLGARPSEDLVELLYRRSAGNPLFTRELLPYVGEGRLPDSLSDLLRHRVELLEPPTRELLDVLAVVAPRAALDVLAELSGRSEEEVEDGLRPAVLRQLVRGEDDAEAEERCSAYAHYSLVHPLLGEVLHADLPPGRRRRLHGGAARALARLRGSGRAVAASEIARHWAVAGDDEALFTWSVRAGLESEQIFAFADVAAHLGRAVTLAEGRPDPAFRDLPVDRLGLLEHAAQAAHLTGDAGRAVELADQALALSHDGLRRGRLLERKGTFCVNAGLAEDAERAYRSALTHLPDDAVADRARVYAGLAMLTMAWSRFDEAEESAREAIRLARRAAARREEGRALNALGVVTAYRGDIEQGTRLLEEALRAAEEVADPDDLAAAYIDLAHVLGAANELDRAVLVCRRGVEAMARVGLDRQEAGFLRANAAESLIKAGRWQDAAELLEEALRHTGQGLRAYPVLVECARLSLCLGDLAEAEQHVTRIRTLLEEFGWPVGWRRELAELRAELALWSRRPTEATQIVAETLDAVTGSDEEGHSGTLLALGLRAAADHAEELRARGEAPSGTVASGRGLLVRVRSMAPEVLKPEGHVFRQDDAVALTALAELSRLDGSRDPEPWAGAAAAWEGLHHALPGLYARWREAEAVVLSRPVSAERSVRLLRGVHETASALGARLLVAEAERLATWARVDLGSGQAPAPPVLDLADLGLTAREREVLAGLVAGRSNGEIAASLFISTKTASVHVSNILRKLGARNRNEAASLGHRLGLTTHGA